MKKRWIIGVVLLIASAAFAQNEVTLPYSEFKDLYNESLKTKWDKDHDTEDFLYSVDYAAYTMTLSREGALCDAVIRGVAISGKPKPIPLFDNRVIIRDVAQVTGGTLMCHSEDGKVISFLAQHEEAFDVHVSYFIPAGEDNRSWIVTMSIPKALTNSLCLKTDQGLVVTSAPGMKDSTGLYHFPTHSSISVRFVDREKGLPETAESLATRYKTAKTPAIVLNSIECYTSFEENGNCLTVISMELPWDAGDSLKIKAAPDADIWDFTVNGAKQTVFETGEKDKYWILPLAKDTRSDIKLCLLSKGVKMGLSGQLAWSIPPLMYPARNFNVGLGLPERVELTAFNGPVSPSRQHSASEPREFTGKHYYFSQSFYKGEGVSLAVSYREPAK